MGTLYLAAAAAAHGLAPEAAAKKSGSSPFTLIIIVALFAVVYFVVLRPQRARQRRAVQTQGAVVPGQKVRTTAGMYGTVVSGDDKDVVIEIAPGVQVRMLRRAIMEVIPDQAPEPDTGTSEHGDSKDDVPPDDWDFKDKKA